MPKFSLKRNYILKCLNSSIFVAGCVLIELFTDGSINPFSFSQLLAYRAGEYEPNKVLDKIEDEEIKVAGAKSTIRADNTHLLCK